MKDLPRRSGAIIMRRYETSSTLMTSNRPLDDRGKLIGDVPSATAMLDDGCLRQRRVADVSHPRRPTRDVHAWFAEQGLVSLEHRYFQLQH